MQLGVKSGLSVTIVDPVIDEIASECLLMRTRLISRVLTAEYEAALQPFGIGAAQFLLLTVIGRLQPAHRAAIGRAYRQDRSTLTRNLQLVLRAGWAEENSEGDHARQLRLTADGLSLMHRAAPAWRATQASFRELFGKEDAALITRVTEKLTTGR